ncbi:MAG TPA: hypothetical protein VFQ65_33905, partial [Kofleriaceae bacterium]|nr:hypothetical protein [Kofleriaceae bacterium]
MRYFGLSERDGRLYWETSRDGVTFDAFYDAPTPFDVSLVTVSDLRIGVEIGNNLDSAANAVA